MENSELRLCHGNRPWIEASPQDLDGDDVVDEIWVRLECPKCRVKTDPHATTEEAAKAWNAGKVK